MLSFSQEFDQHILLSRRAFIFPIVGLNDWPSLAGAVLSLTTAKEDGKRVAISALVNDLSASKEKLHDCKAKLLVLSQAFHSLLMSNIGMLLVIAIQND